MLKGLTQYPVFLLVITSMLALSIIYMAMSRDLVGSIRQYAVDNSTTNPRYIVMNNSLYVEATGYNELYELVYYENGTVKMYHVPPFNATLYGPLSLPENISKIMLLSRVRIGFVVLDILSLNAQVVGLSIKSSKTVLPPTLYYWFNGNYSILRSINGIYHYYVLKPIPLTRYVDIPLYSTLNISYDQYQIQRGVVPETIRIYNGASNNTELDQLFTEDLSKYGNITQSRRYSLNLYLSNEYKYMPSIFYVYNYSYSSKITVYGIVNIGKINISESYSLLKTIINYTVSSIMISDLSGRRYSGSYTVQFTVELSNSTTTREIDLGRYEGLTNEQNKPYRLEKNFTLAHSGEYDVRLLSKYMITIPPPTALPVYVTINYRVAGGGSDYTYLRTYDTDKIVLNINSSTSYYIPSWNNTVLVINISKSLLSNYTLTTNRNDVFDNVSVYSIEYIVHKPLSINYTVYAHPSLVIYKTINIEVKIPGNQVIMYNVTYSRYRDIIGVFSLNKSLKTILIFKPLLIIDDKDYLLINRTSNIYMVKNDSTIIFYIGKQRIPVNKTFFIANIFVLDDLQYDKPIVFFDEGFMGGLIEYVTVNITYVTGENLFLNITNPSSGYSLTNEPIKTIVVTMHLRSSGIRGLFSYRLEKPVCLLNNKRIYWFESFRLIKIGLSSYYLVYLNTTYPLLYSFGQ